MPDPGVSTIPSKTVDALIEQWFFESFQGSVVARSTEIWNAVYAAKEDLKHRLVPQNDAPNP